MRKKRLAALLAALLLALALPACSAAEEPPAIRIGVAVYLQEDTFISTITQHLQQMAMEEEQARGVKINLSIADSRGNQSVQNEQVDRFLDRGCDVICVNIVDRTAAAVLVDKAQAAGVPIIFFNREPVEEDLNRWERAYYVGSKADRAGKLQGELVLNAWHFSQEELDRNGDGVLQYVMLEGEPGHQDALMRTEYSVRTLVSAGVPVEKLANNNADWQRGQAKMRMQQWLGELEKPIEVIFANNDDMALGAIDALVEEGIPPEEMPFIVGVDATPPALAAMAEGSLKGTVQNDAKGQAERMLELCCKLAFGEELPPEKITDGHYVWLWYTAVTKENLTALLGELS